MNLGSALAGAAALLAQTAPAIDWSTLPDLAYRAPPQITPNMTAFVLGEVKAGRCVLSAAARANAALNVDVAVMVDGDGLVRTAIPRAIQCPTVEQYAAGIVTSFARNNLLPRPAASEQWYRASVTFSWR